MSGGTPTATVATNTKLKKGSYTLVASFPGNFDLLASSARKPLTVIG